MIGNHVTNNHLKSSIKDTTNFINNNTEVPDDLMEKLTDELKVSNLIIPAIIDGDFMDFKDFTLKNGMRVLGLFTDMDEFNKFDKRYEPISNGFAFYLDMVHSHHFDGIIINPQSENYFIDSGMLFKIDMIPEASYDDPYSALKLKEIGESVENEPLVEFIREGSNLRNYEDLIGEIESSTLLNVVTANKSPDSPQENGIYAFDDLEGFNLSVLSSTNIERFVVLFTSKGAIVDTCDMSESTYYYQVSDLSRVLEFALANDLDGAIINPGLDDYFIPRDVLLKILCEGHFDNRNLRHAHDYAFILE